MSGSKKITVSREYRNSPDECTRAIELLLKESVNKAARPAPEPDGRVDVSITHGKEVNDVDHRPDK